MIRRAARVDANHGEIVAALRAVGVYVHDTSAVADGFPDLCCLAQGITTLVEVKDGRKPPSARKLTPDQVRFHENARRAGVTVHVVESIEQALELFGARVAA